MCWSGPNNINNCKAMWSSLTPFTAKGGGTSNAVNLDVKCNAFEQWYLHLAVRSPSGLGKIPPILPGNWNEICDTYSLSYSIVQTSDGYVPGNPSTDPVNP